MLGIQPVTYKYYPMAKEIQNRQSSVDSPVLTVQNKVQPFCCTFLGKDYVPRFESVDLTPVLDIGDVSCPVCGVKTLSDKKLQNIIEEVGNVDNPKDLVKLFELNKDYIPRTMRKMLLSNSDKYLNNSELTVHDYFNDVLNYAINQKTENLNNLKDFLSFYSEKLEEGELKSSISDMVNKINSDCSYKDFKECFFKVIKNENIDKSVRKFLLYNLFDKYRMSRVNLGVCHIPKAENLSQNELAKLFVTNVFSNSLIKNVKISRFENSQELMNNSVLVCKFCDSKFENLKTFTDFRSEQNPRLTKFLLQNYLSNIAKLMGEGKITSSRHYFNNFTFYISKLTKGNIEFSQNDIDKLASLRLLSHRREVFEPIEQSEVDVPCACCGSIMLPHSKRVDIYLSLLEATKLSDYAKILEDNNKYVGVFAKNFRDVFFDIYNEEPNLSIDEFAEKFYSKSREKLRQEVTNLMVNFNKEIKYLEFYGTSEQIEFAYLVRDRLKDYISSGNFEDFNYSNLINNVFSDFDFNSAIGSKSFWVLLNGFKTIAYKSLVLNPENKYNNPDTDVIFTTLFNFFKSDVATADHLYARDKGGESTKNNLIGLCKGCNTLKSNKSIEAWYTQFYSVRKNIKRHLQVIDDMAKNGVIEGYDDWAKNLADYLYNNTRGKCDIRRQFKNQ